MAYLQNEVLGKVRF